MSDDEKTGTDDNPGAGRLPNTGAPAAAPPVVTRAAAGDDLTAEEDFDLFSWLLGATTRPVYDVTATVDTPVGRRSLVFRVQGLDGEEIAAIEREHRLVPGNPISELKPSVNAPIVAGATLNLRDPTTGTTVDIRSERFRGDVPDPALALEARTRYMPGVVEAVADEIRAIAGYRPDSVLGTRPSAEEAATGNASEPAASPRGSTPPGATAA